MKTVTEKKTIEKTVHKYISNDGKKAQIIGTRRESSLQG